MCAGLSRDAGLAPTRIAAQKGNFEKNEAGGSEARPPTRRPEVKPFPAFCTDRSPAWSCSSTPKTQESTYARKAKASAWQVPPASCRLGRACDVFHFLFVAVYWFTTARTHVLLQFFVSDHTLATSSHRPYKTATMPVALQVILPAL
jgi:hypothetical protein